MSFYKYASLSAGSDEVRLLKLLPGQFSEDIEIEISHVPFSNNMPEYEALSYIRGSTEDPRTIKIRDTSGEGSVVLVSQNLEVALRQLRPSAGLQMFWIDAICINRADIAERSNEVGRMGDIFSKACQVVVWLGPKSLDSDLAMARLQRIGEDTIYDMATNVIDTKRGSETRHLARDEMVLRAKEADWIAIKNVLCREWFNRLWIIQEIRLAAKAVMVIGDRELSWETIAKVIPSAVRQYPSLADCREILDLCIREGKQRACQKRHNYILIFYQQSFRGGRFSPPLMVTSDYAPQELEAETVSA